MSRREYRELGHPALGRRPINGFVVCNGTGHTFVLRPNGRLHLENHAAEDLVAEHVVTTLAQAHARGCIGALLAWRIRSAQVPVPISGLAATRRRLARFGDERRKQAARKAWETTPDRLRAIRRRRAKEAAMQQEAARQAAGALVRDAFEACDYRTPSERWVDRAGVAITVYDEGTPHVRAETERVWHTKFRKRNYPGTLLNVYVRLAPEDYVRLHRATGGTAVAPDARRVLLAGQLPAPRGLLRRGQRLVVAGRQSRGMAIEAAQAIIERRDGGDWRIVTWL